MHLKMGTSNVAKLKFMAEQKCYTSRGFDITVEKKKNYGRCAVCDAATMHQVISHEVVERETVPGVQWHFDVSGPFVESTAGNKYMNLFVENVTGHLVLYFTKTKSDADVVNVLKKFADEWVARMKARGVYNIRIQSDNGEFKSNKAQKYCNKADIYQKFTAPYHSSSNGRAERAIGTVKATGRILLAHSGLGEEFWELAADCAVFLLVRTPNKEKGQYVRESLFRMFGHTSHYGRLKVFGVKATVLDKDKLKNWKPPGISGIFVGYENEVTYRIWIPEEQKYVCSANVTFDEKVPAKPEASVTTEPQAKEEPPEDGEKYKPLIGTMHTDPRDMCVYKIEDIKLKDGQWIAERSLWHGQGDVELEVTARDARAYRDFNCRTSPSNPISLISTFDQFKVPTDRRPKRPRDEGFDDEDGAPVDHAIFSTPKPTRKLSSPAGRTVTFQPVAPGGRKPRRVSWQDELEKGLKLDYDDLGPPLAQPESSTGPRTSSSGIASTARYGTRSRGRVSAALNALTLIEVKVFSNVVQDFYVPKTFAQVLLASNKDSWLDAMRSEMQSLHESGCIEEVVIPRGKTPLMNKWVFALKTDSEGVIQRYKARLVARGDQAEEGVDFFESYSPVVRWESIRIFIALTVLLKLVPLQLDVDTAYLYADLEEEIYMLPPPGTKLRSGYGYRLKKSLYGLPQSGRNWNKLLHRVLADWDFIRLDDDYCCYFCKKDGIITLLFIYVDDLMIASTTRESLRKFTEYLASQFKIKILGVPQQLLGIQLSWGRNFRSVHLSASKLIRKLLAQFWTEKDGYKEVPMNSRLKLLPEDQLMNTAERYLTKEDKAMQKQYRTIVGTFIFLVNTCRADITFANMILCRSMANPGWKHFKAAKEVLSYFAKYPDLGISYHQSGNMRPYGYCDADHGSDWTRRTITGYMFFLAGGPISWKSKLIKEVCLATAESEVQAIHAALAPIREAAWLIKVQEEIGPEVLGPQPFNSIKLRTSQDFSNMSPVVIFEDNKACIQYAQNPTGHTLMKHLDRQLRWIRQQVENKTIKLEYLETVLQIADLFTKPLEPGQFWNLVSKFMMTLDQYRSLYPEEE